MNGFAAALLVLSLKGALVAALVALVVAAGGGRLPPALRHGLWLLVFLRLLVPVAPASPTSLLALSPAEGGLLPGLSTDLLGLTLAGGAEAAAAAASSGHAAPPSWPAVILAFWGAGFAILIVRRLAGAYRLRRLLRTARPVTEGPAVRLVAKARRALGVRRPVHLVETRTEGPAVTGILRPRIVLPRDLLRSLSEEELRHVLLHELAHVRRLDGAVRAAAGLVAAAHWFNPFAWYALRRLDVECEAACDAAVLARLGGDEGDRRAAYGRTLIDVAARPRHDLHPLGAGILALSHHRNLERRVLMIARYRTTSLRTALVCLLLFAAVAAVSLTDAPLEAGPRQTTTPAPAADGKGDPAEAEHSKETLTRLRNAGTAMFQWVNDAADGRDWPQGGYEDEQGRMTWTRCPAISHQELEALLVPDYIGELPEADAWGHSLEFCLARPATLNEPYAAGVRSPGRDGAFEGTAYEAGAFPVTDLDRDTVWIDGYFITWPSAEVQ